MYSRKLHACLSPVGIYDQAVAVEADCVDRARTEAWASRYLDDLRFGILRGRQSGKNVRQKEKRQRTRRGKGGEPERHTWFVEWLFFCRIVRAMARKDKQPNDNCDRETEEENGWRFRISEVRGKSGPERPHPKQTLKHSEKREQRERECAPSAHCDQNADPDQLPDKNSDEKVHALGLSKGQAVRVVPAFIVNHDSQVQHGHCEESGCAGVPREEVAAAKDSK
jgi:hypothetical protein